MKNKEIFDVLIVGAGPSGSNTAISYKNLNPDLKVELLTKLFFQEISLVVMQLVLG